MHSELIPILALAILVIIMLTMSIVLYRKLKNRLFLILTGSFTVAVLGPVLLFLISLGEAAAPMRLSLITLLKISYICTLMGVYHLYKPKDTKALKVYLGAIGLLIFMSFLSMFINIGILLVEFIFLAFIGYCIYFVTPQIRKKQVYLTALLLVSAASALEGFNSIGYTNIIAFISSSLQFLSYSVIFLIFFERIVDILQAASYKSITDGLTKLYNKTYYLDHVTKKMAAGDPISVIFCDIDNFKKLNDTQGHEEGDKVLQQVAKIVQEEVGSKGIAARYGGEEIVAMLHQDAAEPNEIAENIRRRVQIETIVTLSIGYSKRDINQDNQNIIDEADKALYKAKNSGKNKIIGYTSIQNLEE